MGDHQDTSLGDDIDGGLPGYGRTFDEAIEDAYHHGDEDRGDPGWYKVVIVPGG